MLDDDHRLEVEIADSQELRARGLMHRTNLPPNQGMLFVFPDQAIRAVWMKNTLLALDVLFLAADGSIVSMLHNLPPCKQDPCPTYSSSANAQYMLEVNAGFIERHNLKTGQDLIIDYRHDNLPD